MPTAAAPPPKSVSGSPKYFGIQVLRAFAAVIVVLHHQAEAAGDLFVHLPSLKWLLRGSFGVDIFFPISGFVMYLTAASVLRRPEFPGAWKDFAWRRLIRVAPLYWICTLVKLAIFLAFPALLVHYRFRLWNTLAAFLFLPALNYMGQPEPPLVVGWTLSYEMLFYTIIAVLIAYRAPLLRWAAIIIGVLSILGLFLPHRWGGLTYLADPIELEFLAGMAIAAAARQVKNIPAFAALVCGFGALAWAFCYPTPALEFQPVRALYWGIPGAIIVLAIVSLENKIRFSRSRLLLLLGDASYSLYLTHTFVIPAVRALFSRLHWQTSASLVPFFLTGLLASLGIAILIHLYVEAPMLRWMNQSSTTRRLTAPL